MVRAKSISANGSELGKGVPTIANLPPFHIGPVLFLFPRGWMGLSVLVARDEEPSGDMVSLGNQADGGVVVL